MAFRREHDMLGEKEIPADALYGIHTLRAVENFPVSGRRVHGALVEAYGAVKLAAARANRALGCWDERTYTAIEAACLEMADGKLHQHILVDAMQGGAGTSTNMNVNEVLANRALVLLGKKPGEHETIHPLDDINRHQSTNDTFPTALKVAAIRGVRTLEQAVVHLVEAFQEKEKEFGALVKIGRTQLQDAVLTTLGREMSAYAEAFSRDRWRIYKCEERLRVVNLGGTAIGTGLGAPRLYIFRVVEELRQFTSLGLARAENLIEATQNADVFVEVSGILRALASSLLKVSNDFRLLSSGPDAGLAELRMPPRQAGSSIMPGKVNPVICESVGQAAIAAMGHDQIILQAASGGNLDLNQFYPLIADSLLQTLDLLTGACDIFQRHCLEDLRANEVRLRENVANSTATVTALLETLGYDKTTELALAAEATGRGIRQLAIERELLTADEFDRLITPERVTRLGSKPRNDKPKDTA